MVAMNHNELFSKYLLVVNNENKKVIKALLTAMEKNGLSYIEKQKINFNQEVFENIYFLYNELKKIFDYKYNNRLDLEMFFDMIINNNINFYAIFCPGYTDDGYKNRLGKTTTTKIKQLKDLKVILTDWKINYQLKCLYADIFLENCDNIKNKNWEQELDLNKKLFMDFALNYFDESEIGFLSDIFDGIEYKQGFINKEVLEGRNYQEFMKYNQAFYKKMGWDNETIKFRNDKLYTIYCIIADYLKSLGNTAYLPMENMYARTKVFTKKGVCSMYLNL